MDDLTPPATEDDRVSDQLERWLGSDHPTTVGTMGDVFGDKILAVATLILMMPSALPIPTGGATNVFEVIAFVFAAQLAIGRDDLWIPDRWENREIAGRSAAFVDRLIRMVRWCERFSRPRFSRAIDSRVGRVLIGIELCIFVLGAFFSPPFSGLDTLPALGVVLVCLGFILEDIVFVLAGTVVGVGGIGLTITLGAKVAELVRDLV